MVIHLKGGQPSIKDTEALPIYQESTQTNTLPFKRVFHDLLSSSLSVYALRKLINGIFRQNFLSDVL